MAAWTTFVPLTSTKSKKYCLNSICQDLSKSFGATTLLGGELLSPFQKQVLKAFTGSKKARHVKSGQISLETMIELAKKKDPGLDEYYLAVRLNNRKRSPTMLPD